jgi:signal recognition particle GTPase
LPTALSWCIADKYQQHHLSTDIMRLEQQKLLLTADIRTRSTLNARIRSQDLRESVEAKIATRRARLQIVDERLTKCVNLAKYWQQRGFNNETARTGRTPSHRSSR